MIDMNSDFKLYHLFFFISKQEGYGVIVLNPNENYIEVEKPKPHKQSSSDGTEEPAEKRERKDKVSKETKKRRDFYEKYRNPQKEKEMMQLFIRVRKFTASLRCSFAFLTISSRINYYIVLKTIDSLLFRKRLFSMIICLFGWDFSFFLIKVIKPFTLICLQHFIESLM